MEKIVYVNVNQKGVRGAVLIPDKIDFKSKEIPGDLKEISQWLVLCTSTAEGPRSDPRLGN